MLIQRRCRNKTSGHFLSPVWQSNQTAIEPLKVILGVSWVISGRRYDDGPPPWGVMGVEETPMTPEGVGHHHGVYHRSDR